MKKTKKVESYIVRIYRRSRNGMPAGIVEAAASGWQKPFRNVAELTDILVSPKRRSGRLRNGVTDAQAKIDE